MKQWRAQRKNRVFIGSLDTVVEVWEQGSDRGGTGAVIGGEAKFGDLSVERVEKVGEFSGEEDEGKVLWVNERTYHCRYVTALAERAVDFFIRDFDGDFEIHHVELIGRKRWLLLRTSKRE